MNRKKMIKVICTWTYKTGHLNILSHWDRHEVSGHKYLLFIRPMDSLCVNHSFICLFICLCVCLLVSMVW